MDSLGAKLCRYYSDNNQQSNQTDRLRRNDWVLTDWHRQTKRTPHWSIITDNLTYKISFEVLACWLTMNSFWCLSTQSHIKRPWTQYNITGVVVQWFSTFSVRDTKNNHILTGDTLPWRALGVVRVEPLHFVKLIYIKQIYMYVDRLFSEFQNSYNLFNV